MVIKRKTLENGVIIFLAFLIIISLAKDSVPADGADVNEGYDVPIIMYHAIMKDPARSGDYVITPDMLRKDVEYILDNGYTPVFMTDIIIKKLPLVFRNIALLTGGLLVSVGCIFAFGWFQAEDGKAWVMFFVSFALSCGISTLVSAIAEKQENRRLEEALKRFKEGN